MPNNPPANQNAWSTAITRIEPNHVVVRGYDIAELMGNISFGSAVYLILKGELPPTPEIGKLMNAILVASIDHGATPPSVLAARTVASTGAPLSASVAAGIMSINQHHGGAIENSARNLALVIKKYKQSNDWDEAAQSFLNDLKSQHKRMPGFGHRIHTADPRTKRLFQAAQNAGITGNYIQAAQAVERAFETNGRKLPINVDGAMGAVLAELGFPFEVMNGFFMIARTAGLVAHVHEEKSRMKPMRKIDPVNHTYDGPEDRHL